MIPKILEERVKSVHSYSEICLLLIASDREDLLPTALEGMYIVTQTIIDEHCVIRDGADDFGSLGCGGLDG